MPGTTMWSVGNGGSSEEHLTVTQFKVERERERLAQLQKAAVLAQAEAEQKTGSQKPLRRKRPGPRPNWTMLLRC